MSRIRLVLVAAALLALGIGGTATATSLITGKQVKNGSLTGQDIKNRSIKRADIGFSIPGGGAEHVKAVDSQTVHLQPGETTVDAVGPGNFEADCPSGYVVVGTGFNAGIGNVDYVQSFGTFVGGFVDNDTSVDFDVSLQAICARGSAAGTASLRERNRAHARYRRDQMALAATHISAQAAKSCSSSFTRARINGAIKCLRVGEYCTHRFDHRSPRRYSYKHYGFACKKRDSYGSYHLTYR